MYKIYFQEHFFLTHKLNWTNINKLFKNPIMYEVIYKLNIIINIKGLFGQEAYKHYMFKRKANMARSNMKKKVFLKNLYNNTRSTTL